MSSLRLFMILMLVALFSGCAPGPKPKPVNDPPNFKEEDITEKSTLPKIEETPSEPSTQPPTAIEPTRPPVTDPNRPPKRTLIWPQQKGSGGSVR